MSNYHVGRFTLGLTLIIVGLGMVWNMYADAQALQLVTYWPFILLLLGGEIIWSQRQKGSFRMDALSIMLLTLLVGGAVFAQSLPLHWSFSPQHRYVRDAYWQENVPWDGEVHTVMIRNVSGDVKIEPNPADKVWIEGQVQVSGTTQKTVEDLLQSTSLQVTQSGPVIRIEVERPSLNNMPNFSIQAELSISIPQGLDVEIETVTAAVQMVDYQGEVRISSSTGSVRVSDFQGPINVNTTTGQITIERLTGNLRAVSSTGSVTLEDILGDALIDTTTGWVTAHHIGGSLNVTSSTGSVQCQEVQGTTNIHTTTGRVTVINPGGRLDVSTSTGSIEARSSVALEEGWDLETNTGAVSVVIPREAKVNLRGTGRRINTDFPGLSVTSTTAETTTPNEGPLIRLRSRTGTVTITGSTH